MTELQQNRYDQLLRRVGDLKGPGSKVGNALADLFPVLDVENVPAELLLLMGSRLCMGRITIAAGGAGNFSQAILNRPSSNAIGRVIAVTISGGTAQQYLFGPTQQGAGPLAGSQGFSDTRVFGQGTIFQVTGFNNLLVGGGGLYGVRVPVGESENFIIPNGMGVLGPTGGFAVSCTAANSILEAHFLWVERTAQPSELNF